MASSTADMSVSTKQMLAKVRQMVPPMLSKFHKGQLGRVAVIGGSENYTGAPYFSAMASAKLGCDMSHIICTPGAGAVIKTYSPNLMVHPLMRETSGTGSSNTDADPSKIAQGVIDMLPRLHVLVMGPGLGRDPLMQEVCAKVLKAARERGMPVVLDADALAIVTQSPEIVKGWREAVLTPNVVEFGRLWKGIMGDEVQPSEKSEGGDTSPTARVEKLAAALGGVTIVEKGRNDHVSNGDSGKALVVDLPGGLKRSGGQGDTLTGSIATFLAWRKAYMDGLWDHGGGLEGAELLQLAAFGGSAITRESSRLAFEKKGRSLQASDLTEEVQVAFLNLIGEPTSHSSHL